MKLRQKRRQFLKQAGLLGASLTAGHSLRGNTIIGKNDGLIHPDARLQRAYTLNDVMKEDRDIALQILKPSKRDLEYGLGLHKESVVFDTYGFMPRAAYDGEAIAAAIESGASELELKDLTEEQSMTRFVKNIREQEEFLNAWKASGVTCVFQNAGEESNTVKVLLKRLARFTYVTDMMGEHLRKAVQPDDLLRAKKEDRHTLDMVSVEEELRYIQVFYQLGVRMMHLTYNRRNLIGDGCGEKTDAGLSDFGREVVKEMNRVGVLVDVAHSGWQTGLDAALLSDKPIVASHTAVASLHHHIRSKPDQLIRAIANNDGYLGICCIPRFLGGEGNIGDMMNHIDYIVKKYGSRHVGIGTDVAYTSSFAPEENKKIPAYRRTRTRWESLWPPSDDFKETQDMRRSMAWTNWPLFTVGLVQRGYSDDDIRKIIGGNAMRVLTAVGKG